MRNFKLRTNYIGKRIYYFEEVNSTNGKAYGLAGNVKEGTVIIAEKQKKGIGRFGREWISPKGGLYVSIILKPKIRPIDAPKVTLIAGIAVAKDIRKLGLDAKLKWPNDVLIHGKKVGGILTSISTKEGKIDYIIVGIGINVNVDINTFPKELQKSATSIKEELKTEVPIEKIIGDILFEMETNYETLKQGNFTYLLNEWKKLSDTIGNSVRVKTKAEVIDGVAVGVNCDGALILACEDGSLKDILAGECIHLRNGGFEYE